MNGYDPKELRRAYREMQSGEPRMRAIRGAITAAEQAHDDSTAMLFHHDLIKESVFSGDRFQALVDFPQYLALAARNPELQEEWSWDTLWMFKWIVEASTEFWQIEKKQLLGWFSEFRRNLQRNGYSLRTWYEKRAILYSYCDRAKMRLDYEDFLRSPKDSMGDGEACELDSMVRFELAIGNREKALEIAETIFRKQLRTEEVPCKTYMYLLYDALKTGDMEKAAVYAKKLRPLCDGERFQLEPIGLLLWYDAIAEPKRGLQFYEKNLPLRTGSRNPFLCFWFDRGAYRVLAAAAEAGMALQNAETGVLTDADGLRKLAEQTYANCQDLAAKFDARNRSDYFSLALQGDAASDFTY